MSLITRIFAAMLLVALVLAAGSVASVAARDHHHSGVGFAATQSLDADAGKKLIAAKADCDRAGQGNNCCSYSCGQATCSLLTFPGPEAFQFDAPPRIAFPTEPGQLLTPGAVLGLLKPPQAATI